ncbi:hypothetical protein ES703_09078 [subsurface metagenome]
MGFGRGKGFSPPVAPPFPEDYTGPFELKVADSRWTKWLRYLGGDVSYLTAHDHPDATHIGSSHTRFCSQSKIAANYWDIARKPLYFDTSSIPANAVIPSVILYQFSDFVAGSEKDIHLVDAPDLHDPPVVGDYGYLLDLTTSLGVLETADMAPARRNTWFINQAGLNAIVKGGQTKWGMRTIDDINAAAPLITVEGIYLNADPTVLIVTYYLPP